MILIDALYINTSGGKVLLDYLIEELEKTSKEIFYLLDKRVEGKVSKLVSTKNKVLFLEASLFKRRKFYLEHRDDFSSILCFGNLPPNVKMKVKVFTYFHQLLFLNLPQEMPFLKKSVYYLKTRILNHFKVNSDYWLVQSYLVKKELSKKYKINQSKIMEMPFYPPFNNKKEYSKIKNTYLYISNAPPHKNHIRLIESFSQFYKKYNQGKLILTISDSYPELLKLIEEKQRKGVLIENIGFVPRDDLQKLYSESQYLIFPSLTESFGLGLVEGIENGCKVIGADLPYTYAVCEPSLTFNPLEIESIINALSLTLHENIKPSISKVNNNITNLLNLLN